MMLPLTTPPLLLAAIPWNVWALATVFVVICVFMMLVILIQKPKGGGLSGAFGGAGGTESSFVGAKVGDFLTWLTVGCFVLFILLAMGLTWSINPGARIGGVSASQAADAAVDRATTSEGTTAPAPGAGADATTPAPADPSATTEPAPTEPAAKETPAPAEATTEPEVMGEVPAAEPAPSPTPETTAAPETGPATPVDPVTPPAPAAPPAPVAPAAE